MERKIYIKPKTGVMKIESEGNLMAASSAIQTNSISSDGSYLNIYEDDIAESDAGEMGAAKNHQSVWE